MTKGWKASQTEYKEELESRNNLMIVDGLNLGFRFQGQVKKPFASNYLNTVQSFAKSYSARDTIILSDKGVSTFRKNIHEGYKGQRAERNKNKTEEEQEQTRMFFEYFEEAFELASTVFPSFRYRGVEADDMAGLIVAIALEFGNYDNIWLISTDGDWDTLLQPKVKRFSYKTRREYTVESMYEEHGVDSVEQFISLKAIMGDPGDSINGVDGIGAKRGYALLREYGTVMDIIDSMPIPGKQQFIKNLNNSADLLMRNIQLVDLPSFSAEAIQAAGVYKEFYQQIKEIVIAKA